MICIGGVGGGGKGVFEPWHLIQVFKLPEWLNIRVGCQWRFLFLSFFPFFFVPCMLATFAWELNTTVRTSMTVKDLYHLFQFRREEVQADMLTSLIFVFMILSVSKHFCTSYTNNSRLSKNKQQPRTVWSLIFYFCIQTVHTFFRSRNTKTCPFTIMLFLAWWK